MDNALSIEQQGKGKIKILFFKWKCSNRAGTERILSVMAGALAKHYAVTVVTAWNQGLPDSFPFPATVTRHDLGIDRKRYHMRALANREAVRRLARYIDTHPQDIVVTLDGALAQIPKFKDASKKVFWYHFCLNSERIEARNPDLGIFSKMARRYKWHRKIRLARHFDRLIVLTKKDCELWQKYCNNVTYIHNTVTLKPQRQAHYQAKRVIAVGRLVYQKGFDRLIDAWKRVAERFPDWQLDIYGQGKLAGKLNSMIASQGLQNCVHLHNDTSEIASALVEHSIAVMSSNYEGMPLVLLEEAACGLPLVSLDCECGPSEIVDDGRNGFLVAQEAGAQGIAQALMKLMADDALRQAMGKNAAQSVERFSQERIVSRWSAVIHQIMHS